MLEIGPKAHDISLFFCYYIEKQLEMTAEKCNRYVPVDFLIKRKDCNMK